jgi:hypothetical protein
MEERLPDCLADWIDRKMPELGGVRFVKISYSHRLPFEWLPGDRSGIDGLTLWRGIYLRENFYPVDPCDPEKVELLLHELVHVLQFRKDPLRFPLLYLINHLRYGYWNNPAEVEARAISEKLIQEYLREDVCGCSSK